MGAPLSADCAPLQLEWANHGPPLRLHLPQICASTGSWTCATRDDASTMAVLPQPGLSFTSYPPSSNSPSASLSLSSPKPSFPPPRCTPSAPGTMADIDTSLTSTSLPIVSIDDDEDLFFQKGARVRFEPASVCDYVLEYDGVEFHIHRARLMEASKFF